MSKGQRGNKELKKPKKAPPLKPAGPASLIPTGTMTPDPNRKK